MSTNPSQYVTENEEESEYEDEEDNHWKQAFDELFTFDEKITKLRFHPDNIHVTWIIFPDDNIYMTWGWIVTSILVYTALITPFRLALIDDDDSLDWVITDLCIDGLFFIDFVLNWFLAFYDKENNIITDRKQILWHYATSWMCLDFIAWVPISLLISSSNKNYSSLIRVARLPRLYRLIKIAKLARVIKVIKYRGRFLRHMNEIIHIGLAKQKLAAFLITFLVLLHIIACLWIMIGKLNVDDSVNWIYQNGFLDADQFQLYTAAMYWATTTITTVGYGDINAHGVEEQIFWTIIILIGVFVYSYAIGAIYSIISIRDSREQRLKRRMELLNRIIEDYDICKGFATKLARAVEYENTRNNEDHDELYQNLPTNLRNQLLLIIHERNIRKNAFFEQKPAFFVTFVAPMLQPLLVEPEDYVYYEGSLATEMYFILKGEINYCFKDGLHAVPYLSIPEAYYFGEVDLLLSDDKIRQENAQAEYNTEMLTLSEKQLHVVMKQFEGFAMSFTHFTKQRAARNAEIKNKALHAYQQKFKVARERTYPTSFTGMNFGQQRSPASICSMTIQPILEEESMSESESLQTPRKETEIVATEIRDKPIQIIQRLRRGSTIVGNKRPAWLQEMANGISEPIPEVKKKSEGRRASIASTMPTPPSITIASPSDSDSETRDQSTTKPVQNIALRRASTIAATRPQWLKQMTNNVMDTIPEENSNQIQNHKWRSSIASFVKRRNSFFSKQSSDSDSESEKVGEDADYESFSAVVAQLGELQHSMLVLQSVIKVLADKVKDK